jgi:hypothetical protein
MPVPAVLSSLQPGIVRAQFLFFCAVETCGEHDSAGPELKQRLPH